VAQAEVIVPLAKADVADNANSIAVINKIKAYFFVIVISPFHYHTVLLEIDFSKYPTIDLTYSPPYSAPRTGVDMMHKIIDSVSLLCEFQKKAKKRRTHLVRLFLNAHHRSF
jgi:hypothetical protein